MAPTQSPAGEDLAASTVRTVTLRLMPLLGLLYLIAYIDRQNVSYAKLEMVGSLGLSETAYGLGASLFFLGYFLFEVPANVFLERVGARIWFARIMITWGLVTVLLGFTQGATMFYVLRFLLGVAEAGFFPGVLFALTLWFPHAHRARMIGWFMIASAIANAIGAAIGGALLGLDGAPRLGGLAMGVPGHRRAGDPDGRRGAAGPARRARDRTLAVPGPARLARPHAPGRARRRRPCRPQQPVRGAPRPAGADAGRVYVSLPLAAYGLGYWLPTVVKGFGVSNLTNGLLNVIPWMATAAALWWVPRHAARTGAQGDALTWHVVGPALVGAAGLALSVVLPGNAVKFACLCVAAAGTFAAQPVFWSMPGTFLRGASAAAGIAAINSVGNLGGFVAQNAVPFIRDQTQSDLVPMLFLSACLALGAGLMFLVLSALRRDAARRAVPEAARPA